MSGVLDSAEVPSHQPLEQLKDAMDSNPIPNLTSEQRRILALLEQGLTRKDIAATLRVSPARLQNQLKRVFSALHVHSGVQAVMKHLNGGDTTQSTKDLRHPPHRPPQ